MVSHGDAQHASDKGTPKLCPQRGEPERVEGRGLFLGCFRRVACTSPSSSAVRRPAESRRVPPGPASLYLRRSEAPTSFLWLAPLSACMPSHSALYFTFTNKRHRWNELGLGLFLPLTALRPARALDDSPSPAPALRVRGWDPPRLLTVGRYCCPATRRAHSQTPRHPSPVSQTLLLPEDSLGLPSVWLCRGHILQFSSEGVFVSPRF